MAKVNMATPLDVSADQAWKLIGGFNALPDWHPGVEKSELEDGGKVRRLSLMGGGEIVERLERASDDERVYSYTIESGPLPVQGYRSTIRVKEEGGKATVEWSSEFTPSGASEQDAVAAIQGVYQAGLDNLRKMFSG